jgi:hypothetical protein
MSTDFSIGKGLVVAGLVLLVLGGLFLLFERFGLPLGRLPGDLHFQKGRSSFHFPIVTSLLLSIVATLVLNLLRR